MLPVIITTLGEFSIAYGDKILTEKDKRSKKMWTLLKYLTAFIDRAVTQGELIEVLWSNEDIGCSTGALKTQLHRLRASLGVLGFPPETELVVSYAGTYSLNDAFEYVIDSVEFENCFKKSTRNDISEKEQILQIRKAIELYRGDYLKNSADEKWLIPMRVYYRSVYIRSVHRLINALFFHKQYTELINVCRGALQIENTDQTFHIGLIKALAALGERGAAKKHYKYVMDLLYNELGVNPLPELTSVYREIVESDAELTENLETIQRKLREDLSETESGAFHCEPEIFKNIYRLKVRDSERGIQKPEICLITLAEPENARAEPKKIIAEMKRLHNCVSASLRKNDVFARYSLSQYMIMLSYASPYTISVVLKRIDDIYKAKPSEFNLNFDCKYNMAL